MRTGAWGTGQKAWEKGVAEAERRGGGVLESPGPHQSFLPRCRCRAILRLPEALHVRRGWRFLTRMSDIGSKSFFAFCLSTHDPPPFSFPLTVPRKRQLRPRAARTKEMRGGGAGWSRLVKVAKSCPSNRRNPGNPLPEANAR